MRTLEGRTALGSIALALIAGGSVLSPLFSTESLPQRFSAHPLHRLVWANASADGLITVAYAAILASLIFVFLRMRRSPEARHYRWLVVSSAAFLIASGATHLMELADVWWSLYPLTASFKVMCAVVSIPAAILLARETSRFVATFKSYVRSSELARQAQEEAEHNYRGQIQAIDRSQMVVEFDMQGYVTKVNDNYLRAFGYRRDQVLGKHHSIFVFAEEKNSRSYQGFWNRLRHGTYQSGLFVQVDHEGHDVWIEASYNPVMNASGKPVKVVKIATDVTERVKAQERVEEAESRIALAAESGRIGIWDWDLITHQVAGDVWVYRLYGLGSEVNGKFTYEFWESHLHPDDRAATLKAIADAVQGDEPYQAEFRIVWDDGTIHYLKASGKVARDSNGKAVRMVGSNTDCTQQKLAELALQKSEKLLERTGRLAGIGAWEYDLSSQSLYFSKESYHLLGLESTLPPTIKLALQQISPRDRRLLLAAVRRAFRDGIGWDITLTLKASTPEPVIVRHVGSVEYFSGEPRQLLGTVQDISARVAEQRALDAATTRASLATESSGIGIWDWDINTDVLTVDDTMFRIFGYESRKPGVELQQAWAQHIHPEDRERVNLELSAAIAGFTTFETEFRIVWHDDSIHFIKSFGKVFCNEKREPIRMVGTNADITPRKEAEEELRQSNEKQEMLIRGLKDYSILMLDMAGLIVTWNEVAQGIFGYQADEIIGCHFSKLHKPEDTVEIPPEQELTLAREEGRYEIEGIRVRKDGTEFWANVVVTALYDKDGKLRGYGKVTRDITERKQAEEATRLAHIEAESANRAKSYFLANMSHELRTPMNAIIGMTHLALRANPTPQQHGYLSKISRAAQSLLTIMNDILDFSKIEAGKMELESIAFLLRDVWSNLLEIVEEKASSKNLKLTFTVSPGTPPLLQGDPLRLGQILLNLVNNALKFTNQGEVSVTVSSKNLGDDRVALLFCVKDSGIGMTEEQLSKVFQSFHQGDTSYTRRYGGTGLGLAICRQLCALMQGEMCVESIPGQGSEFYFTVQLGTATMASALPNQEMLTSAPCGFILVVDDSEETRNELEAMLSKNAFNVRSVASGEEALVTLVHASQQNSPFDAVLMDWRLPGIDGIDTVRRMRMQLPQTHQPSILIISAYACADVLQDSDSSGIELLMKPVGEAALLDCLTRSLRRKQEAASTNQQRDDHAPLDLHGRRILLVEDNEINRDLATELLTDFGVSVTVAVNGLEGVQRVQQESFDIVLMDIQMPVMDGLTATQQIRADGRFATLPIIAMTAHAMSGDREKSLKAGMNDHLTKPISPDGLKQMLLHWLPVNPVKPQLPRESCNALSSEERSLLPERLPPFNLKAALERTNNKPKLLHKMLLTFHKQYGSAATTLRAQLAAGDHEDALLLAHSLKGLAATLEANELARSVAVVETALRTGENQTIPPLLEELERALEPAIAAVASLLPTQETIGSTAQTPPPQAPANETELPGTFEANLLVVDDTTLDYEHLVEVLSADYRIEHAISGTAALQRIAQTPPDLILLDVMMKEISGYDLCKTLKSTPATRDIPVIFLTAANDAEAETQGIELGAADYITKPFNPTVVRARLKSQIALQRRQAALLALATTDALTGVANRRRFNEALTYESARHARSGKELGLILLDVDFFKQFNDLYGHVAGDECLQAVAAALQAIAPRSTDLIARYGGEEFVILLPETDLSGTLIMAERVREGISQLAIPHASSTIAPYITVSVGALSAFCFPGLENSELLTKVDRQLYAAKSGGRNRVAAANFEEPNQLLGMGARKQSRFLPGPINQPN